MARTSGSASKLSTFVAILALGCSLEVAPGDEEPGGAIAEVQQGIAGGSVVSREPAIVSVRLAPNFSTGLSGGCTGVLIARDAILTARHCVPSQTKSFGSPAGAVARLSRKLGPSDWECISNYDDVPRRGTTSQNACDKSGLANVYFQTSSGAGGDLALLRPIKSNGKPWISDVNRYMALYAENVGLALQQISWGIGANSNSGSGGGELRGGIFNLNPITIFHSYYEFFANVGYRPCAGDSGAPMGVMLTDSVSGVRFGVAGLISGGETNDEDDACGSSSGVQWAVNLVPKHAWIETALGRTCLRETVGGRKLLNCW